jgi:hypothetical protein
MAPGRCPGQGRSAPPLGQYGPVCAGPARLFTGVAFDVALIGQAMAESARRWEDAADDRLSRASLLATPFDSALSAPTELAVVSVSWSNLMGARYPTQGPSGP